MTTLSSNKVLTISELTDQIKKHLELQFSSICIEGEISNLKKQSSGHIYFSLKDSQSQISAVMFAREAALLKKEPKNGDQIIAKGRLNIYPPRGSYQIIIREFEIAGVGQLLLKLHRLKENLKARGWLDTGLKKTIPKIPKTIGIVTSPTGAVIQDILHVLKRRFAGFHLILYPVKVQGEGAKEEIAQAVSDFNRYRLADVIIVGRGGGSLEDLWAFNEEEVARAIFESKIPVISAVGHETDYSIADLVADIRAPTPSAAAEIVIAEKEHLSTTLQNYRDKAQKALFYLLHSYRTRLKDLQKSPVFRFPDTLLANYFQKIDEMSSRYQNLLLCFLEPKKEKLKYLKTQIKMTDPRVKISNHLQFLQSVKKELDSTIKNRVETGRLELDSNGKKRDLIRSMKNFIQSKKQRLAHFQEYIYALNPNRLIQKGYSILFSEKEDSIILSTKDLKQNDSFYALVSDGKIFATTTRLTKEDKDAKSNS